MYIAFVGDHFFPRTRRMIMVCSWLCAAYVESGTTENVLEFTIKFLKAKKRHSIGDVLTVDKT